MIGTNTETNTGANMEIKYEDRSWNQDQNPGHRSGTKTLDHNWDQYWD